VAVYTLAISNRDLQLSGAGYTMVDGAAKTKQDLRMALGEPLGNDRFHPGYGSQLTDFIGLILDVGTQFQIQQEISRVVQNYIAVQYDRIQADIAAGLPSRFTSSEIVGEVTGIQVYSSQDIVNAVITIKNVDEQDIELIASVGADSA
jgi:phage baseplate assembly protein W